MDENRTAYIVWGWGFSQRWIWR